MNSDDEKSHLGIRKADERLQVLHHAYTCNQSRSLHAVGTPAGGLMSICNMTFSQELMASYGRVLALLRESGLGIFYRDGAIDDIDANDVELERIKKSVKKHKNTFPEEGQTEDFTGLSAITAFGGKLSFPSCFHCHHAGNCFRLPPLVGI